MKRKTIILIVLATIVICAAGVALYFVFAPTKAERYIKAEDLAFGRTIKNGKFINYDKKKALDEIRKLADSEYGPALYLLGDYYSNGWADIQRDTIMGRELYEKALPIIKEEAIAGDMYAQQCLFLYYLDGTYVEKDNQKAFYWANKSAKQGYTDAMFNVAEMYDNGFAVAEDHEIAAKWFYKAACLNNPYAMVELVTRYLDGNGVKVDSTKSNRWLNKLNRMGFVSAKTRLANYYAEKGNIDKAILYLQEAADLNDWQAQINLGTYYLEGNGVKKNIEMAKKLFLQAVKNSDHESDALLLLVLCYEETEEYQKAFKLLKEAASNDDNALAQHWLSLYYGGVWGSEDKTGVAINAKLADYWEKEL